jgi:hypothetical protein
MKLKTLASSILLAFAASVAMADDQSVAFNGSTASFIHSGTVLAGGDDLISFTNLAAGLYNFTLTFSGQWLTLSSATLNGVDGDIMDFGKITFLSVGGIGQTPFVLALTGTADKSTALYSGEISVAAVPEPETYAMFLAGLGALGFVARRRRVEA